MSPHQAQFFVNFVGKAKKVDLSAKEITDETLPQVIEVLKTMPNLTSVDIQENAITNVAPFSELSNLTTLTLGFNQITDIRPLAPLVNLTSLSLKENPVTNIEALKALTKLEELGLPPVDKIEGGIPENIPVDAKEELAKARQKAAAKAKKFYVDKANAQKKAVREAKAAAPACVPDTSSGDVLEQQSNVKSP